MKCLKYSFLTLKDEMLEVELLLTSTSNVAPTETIRTIRDGEPRTATSISTHLLSSEIFSYIIIGYLLGPSENARLVMPDSIRETTLPADEMSFRGDLACALRKLLSCRRQSQGSLCAAQRSSIACRWPVSHCSQSPLATSLL